MTAPSTSHARAQRVAFLVGMLIGLGALDLVLTGWQMSSCGMYEGNPLVRALVGSTGCLWPLVFYKLLLTTGGAGAFLAFRRRRSAEIASWLCVAAYVGVVLMWIGYLSVAWPQPIPALAVQEGFVKIH